jgi:hypothetical protein
MWVYAVEMHLTRDERLPMTSEAMHTTTMPREWPKAPTAIAVLAACIVVLGTLGAYDALVADTHAIDLQGELDQGFTLPAPFSGALLLGVAAFCLLLAAGPDTGVAPRWAWGAFSLLFVEAGIDEAASIHESLGDAAGIDWMVLYTPLIAVAGVLWFIVLRGLRDRPERVLWLGAAGAWVFSQMLEAYAYGGTEDDAGRPGTGPLSAVEELMEMAGSLLLLWTVLSLYRWSRERERREPAERSARSAER